MSVDPSSRVAIWRLGARGTLESPVESSVVWRAVTGGGPHGQAADIRDLARTFNIGNGWKRLCVGLNDVASPHADVLERQLNTLRGEIANVQGRSLAIDAAYRAFGWTAYTVVHGANECMQAFANIFCR